MLTKEHAKKEYSTRIGRTLDFLNRNLDQHLSLRTLSEIACFSPFHFHRIFSHLVGETPNDYVRRLRLEKAANMLDNYPQRSITDIALQCGFSGSAVFARSFKVHFGVSARRWRRRVHDKKTYRARQSMKKHSVRDDNLGISTKPSEPIQIKSLPAYRLAYTQCLEGYNHNIGNAWKTLFRWAYPRNVINQDTIMIGIPLDNPDITPEGKCRYQACITVPRQAEAEGEISIADLEASKYAIYHFKGKPHQIKAAYSYIYGIWLPESGWEPKDRPALEIYTNPPKQKELAYDICLPVKPLSY
jgi:AraC family transcriptional regulator